MFPPALRSKVLVWGVLGSSQLYRKIISISCHTRCVSYIGLEAPHVTTLYWLLVLGSIWRRWDMIFDKGSLLLCPYTSCHCNSKVKQCIHDILTALIKSSVYVMVTLISSSSLVTFTILYLPMTHQSHYLPSLKLLRITCAWNLCLCAKRFSVVNNITVGLLVRTTNSCGLDERN